jgi:hypothetical protein
MATYDDDALIALLRDTLDVIDAPPESAVTAARSAYTWRTVDAELATLISDAATPQAAGARSFSPNRVLSFSSGDTMIVLEIAKERRVRRVLGQVLDATPATVEVRHSGGSVAVDTDEWGRFRAAPLPDGPLSIMCRFDDPERLPISTTWVTV